MKIVISVFLSLFLISFISGQKPDVEVYEKKDGEKTILIARNTGEAEATVKVTITSQGMDVTPSSVVESMIPGGFMKEMAVLVPRKGELWSYSYDVSIRRTVSKPADPASPPSPPKSSAVSTSGSTPQQLSAPAPKLSDAEIILYAKPGCGRCTFAKKQLNSLGIKYVEVDTHSDSPEVPNMWAQMRNQGFKGGSVTMPVIRVNGKYHYDIQDIGGFINKLKS